jgi:glycerol-3-phosphate dehydrogenase
VRIKRQIERLGEPWDVIVVGGGISGVCIAREAAGRGLRTLLLEKGDFGEGTSSATTKYIHGGIRYLEQYQFRVVRESLRERRVLALAAPHLVRQTRFVMPAWKWSKPPAALIGAGVALYDAFSFDRNKDAPPSLHIPHPRWIPKGKLLGAVPWLNDDQLQGAWAYHDTMNVHPERLLLAFLQTGVQDGLVALNHAEVTGFVTSPAPGGAAGVTVEGVRVVDRRTGREHEARSRIVINAGGPWLDLVLRLLPNAPKVTLSRSKGVHVLTRSLGGIPDAVFARARSGKHVIVSPWQGRSWIGPTDTPITDLPDDVAVAESDVRLILDTVNDTINPKVLPHLTEDDVEATAVGIRPLIAEEGKDTYKASRRHDIYDHAVHGAANLWSISGGKWTTGRAMGQEMIEQVLERAPSLKGISTRAYDSRRMAAFGAFGWAQDAQPFLEAAASTRPSLPLDRPTRLHLARLYGTAHDGVLDLIERDPSLAARISDRGDRVDVLAQTVHAVTHESACTLDDIVRRRLVLGTYGPCTEAELRRVAAVVGPLLGWSADDVEREVAAAPATRASG